MLGNFPNISGEVNIPNGRYTGGTDYFNAIQSFIFKSDASQSGNASGGGGGGRIVLNAHNSNAIYSQSNTVQPTSCYTLMIIKV